MGVCVCVCVCVPPLCEFPSSWIMLGLRILLDLGSFTSVHTGKHVTDRMMPGSPTCLGVSVAHIIENVSPQVRGGTKESGIFFLILCSFLIHRGQRSSHPIRLCELP